MPVPTGSGAFDQGRDSIQRRERRPVAMQAFIASDSGDTGEALVLDLSYDGCGIETAVPLKAGQAITLSVPQRGAIRAVVRWCEDGRAGLVFDEPGEKGGNAQDEQKRSAERVPIEVQATLRRIGKGSYRVAVSDLSPGGCKVELVERTGVGEHVLLKFDSIEAIEAEVSWVRDYSAGLRFHRSIHEAVFDLLFERLTEPR